jgi:hypothetical protein
VIWLNALLKFTVTCEPCATAEITTTLLGMAVITPAVDSAAEGPASIERMTAMSGAGGSTSRGSGCSRSLDDRKKTVTGM